MNLNRLQNPLFCFIQGAGAGQDFLDRSRLNLGKKSILMSGMGGSILAAQLFRDLSGGDFPIIQSYTLPKNFNRKKATIFCFSYSGNTEETLAVFRQAKRRGWRTIGFGRGGKLKEICDKKDFIEIPDLLAPRLAVAFMLGVLWVLFGKTGTGVGKNSSLKMKDGISTLIKKMRDKMILIYAPSSLRGLAHFWEINLDETAKQPSFCGEIPDIDHHDLASFMGKKFQNRFFAVFLDDGSFLKKRVELTAKFFRDYLKIDSAIMRISMKNRLGDFLSQMEMVYKISFELARLNKMDPFENKIQERLKNKLKEK